jgi:hypothetical protein
MKSRASEIRKATVLPPCRRIHKICIPNLGGGGLQIIILRLASEGGVFPNLLMCFTEKIMDKNVNYAAIAIGNEGGASRQA